MRHKDSDNCVDSRFTRSVWRGITLFYCSAATFVFISFYVYADLLDSSRSLFIAALLSTLLSPSCAILAVGISRVIVRISFRPIMPLQSLYYYDLPITVIVPVIVCGNDDIEDIVDCANRNVPFVTDLPIVFLVDLYDCSTEVGTMDDSLLERLDAELKSHLITGRCHILVRRRVFDSVDEVWRGWERKRGKVEEFLRMSKGVRNTSFIDSMPRDLIGRHAFLTIDVDTRLVPDTISHLRLSFDEEVAIVAPSIRDTSSPNSTLFSIMQKKSYRGPSTIPMLNFNQFCLGYDLYFGKGLIIVDRFLARLAGRIGERKILSHDHLESMYAGAVSSPYSVIEEDVPASRAQWERRQYRWTRGDLQILPFIFSSGLTLVSRLILGEILLTHIATLFLPFLILAAMVLDNNELGCLVRLLLLVSVRPGIIVFLLSLSAVYLQGRDLAQKPSFRMVMTFLVGEFASVLLAIIYAPSNALMVFRAASVTAWRLSVTGRNLLEWNNRGPVGNYPGSVSCLVKFVVISSSLAYYLFGELNVPLQVLLIAWIIGPLLLLLPSGLIARE